MRFSQMKPKELQKARNELQKRLYPVLKVSKVMNLFDSSVDLTGGYMPAQYTHDNEGLSVWSSGSRYSGAPITVGELLEAQQILYNFFEEYLREESEGDELEPVL